MARAISNPSQFPPHVGKWPAATLSVKRSARVAPEWISGNVKKKLVARVTEWVKKILENYRHHHHPKFNANTQTPPLSTIMRTIFGHFLRSIIA